MWYIQGTFKGETCKGGSEEGKGKSWARMWAWGKLLLAWFHKELWNIRHAGVTCPFKAVSVPQISFYGCGPGWQGGGGGNYFLEPPINLGQSFSTVSNFVPLRNIWQRLGRHLWLSQQQGWYWHWEVGGQDAAKHLTMPRTSPHNKELSPRNTWGGETLD